MFRFKIEAKIDFEGMSGWSRYSGRRTWHPCVESKFS
jgi:hypothetical protein